MAKENIDISQLFKTPDWATSMLTFSTDFSKFGRHSCSPEDEF